MSTLNENAGTQVAVTVCRHERNMKMPYRPQITWKEVSPRQSVVDEIELAAEKMRTRFGDPTSFRVVVSKAQKPHPDEQHLDLKLEMHLKGVDFIVTQDTRGRDQAATSEGAIRHAFDVLRQQVQENLEKRRHSER